jgi:hypothetical protein
MYHWLGTPEEDKVLKIYDTDHWLDTKELIRESLNWLDEYLGPVTASTPSQQAERRLPPLLPASR